MGDEPACSLERPLQPVQAGLMTPAGDCPPDGAVSTGSQLPGQSQEHCPSLSPATLPSAVQLWNVVGFRG